MSHRSHLGHELEQALLRHRHPGAMHSNRQESASFGERAADTVSGFAGSWRFIGIYIALTFAWCGLNVLSAVKHWDPYPYIFYTFSVSVLAILLSSLILLAGNRQAEVDRAHAENAYMHVDEVNAKQDEQLRLLGRQIELIQQQIDSAMQQHGEILRQLGDIRALCLALPAPNGSEAEAASPRVPPPAHAPPDD